MSLLEYSASSALQQRGISTGESLQKAKKNNLRCKIHTSFTSKRLKHLELCCLADP